MISVDASVFAKLFLDEDDRPQANRLIRHAIANRVPLIAPPMFVYEVLSIALRHDVAFSKVLAILEDLRVASLELLEPTVDEWLKAEVISKTGHPKSGYPALADSIYHAMAIERGGMFVTADEKHVAKAKQFGHVTLLADWRPG